MQLDALLHGRPRNALLGFAFVVLLGGVLFLNSRTSDGGQTDAVTATESQMPQASAEPSASSASEAPITAAFGPAFADLRTIKKASATIKLPVYWLGEREGTRIEMTLNSVGIVYLRYLPLDVAAGSDQPFLLVASYPDAKAVDNVRQTTGGGVVGSLPDGTVYSGDGPKGLRMYQATPGTSVQVEVFSPIPGEAYDAVKSGRVVPVGR